MDVTCFSLTTKLLQPDLVEYRQLVASFPVSLGITGNLLAQGRWFCVIANVLEIEKNKVTNATPFFNSWLGLLFLPGCY